MKNNSDAKSTGDDALSSNHYSDLVVNKINALLAYWDNEQICRFANDTYRDWFGRTREEMIDKMTLKELLGPLYEKNLPHIEGALEGKAQRFEREIHLPDGQRKQFVANYYPDIQDGEVKGFVVHVVDINDYMIVMRNLEDNIDHLEQIEERQRRMIAEIKDYSIIMLDVEGNIENWNKGAAKIKGYQAEEIIGKNFRLFYTKEDIAAKKPESLLQKATEEGTAYDESLRVKKDGTTFIGSVTITALHDKVGNVIGFSKVTRDITQQRKV